MSPDTAVDGELVAFDDEGKLSFNALQNAASRTHVVFFAFDILVSEGEDVKPRPLGDRKALLSSSFKSAERAQISEHFIWFLGEVPQRREADRRRGSRCEAARQAP
jgi:ATP-dependent DNA ligase